MGAQHIDAALRKFKRTSRFPGLGIAPSTNRAPDHDERRVAVEIDVRPGERTKFLGTGAGEQRQDDIGIQAAILRGI